MAINGPWLGSSAVAETGQRWMSNAAGAVRQGTPFWMSWLGGRSRQHFEIVVGDYTPSTNIRYRGFGQNSATGISAFGAKQNGDWPGYECTGLWSANGNGILALVGGPDRSWTIQFLDGSQWTFTSTNYANGRRTYRCTDGGGFQNYLAARVNQTLGVIVL